jgi:dihydroneopterin aldolase
VPDDLRTGYSTILDLMQHPAPQVPSAMRHYDLTIRDYVGLFRIGVWQHEHGRTQRVRVNLTVTVEHPKRPFSDDLGTVVSYEYLINGIRALQTSEHIQLVEVLAEQLMRLCLSDPRAVHARVQVEKLDIVPESAGVGIVIEGGREGLT